MMVTWMFWLSFWSAVLGGPDEPILMPVPLALPSDRAKGSTDGPSATVIDLAEWRIAHPPGHTTPTGPDRQGPTGGRAA